MSSRALRRANIRDGEGHAVARDPRPHIPLTGKTLLEFEAGVQALMIHMVADGHGWSVEDLYEAIGAELGAGSNPTMSDKVVDTKVRQLRENINEALQQLERADVE